MKERILIIDDEKQWGDFLSLLVSQRGWEPVAATDPEVALDLLKAQDFSIALTDLRMPKMDGIELMKKIKALKPSLPVIIITAYSTVDAAIESMKQGAFDYITKPFNNELVLSVMARAIHQTKLERENQYLFREGGAGGRIEDLVGNSEKMQEVYKLIGKVAASNTTILIRGESGTGKELIARAAHLGSPRRDRAFVSVNCAALPHALLESELFGHTRGAFTGAVRDRRGLFSAADRGTIFLDEIGEMAPELQGALLRVLQSGEYRPVGSDEAAHTDVRIVAATKRSLAEEVRAGRFREDLFFRLNGVHVRVPPLRERREDIPLLVGRFLEKFKVSGEEPALTDEARACLMAHDYPGNVRELETIIRRAMLFAKQGKIGIEALPPSVTKAGAETLLVPVRVPATGAQLLAAKRESSRAAASELERAFLLQALALSGNRPGEAARRAGMNRSQFEKMLSRHGLSGRQKDE
jgi:DNA-binding NtrC family response regulator